MCLVLVTVLPSCMSWQGVAPVLVLCSSILVSWQVVVPLHCSAGTGLAQTHAASLTASRPHSAAAASQGHCGGAPTLPLPCISPKMRASRLDACCRWGRLGRWVGRRLPPTPLQRQAQMAWTYNNMLSSPVLRCWSGNWVCLAAYCMRGLARSARPASPACALPGLRRPCWPGACPVRVPSCKTRLD